MTPNACRGHVVLRMRAHAHIFAALLILLLIIATYSVQISDAQAQSRSAEPTAQLQAEYLSRTNSVALEGESFVSQLNGEGTVIGIFDGGLNLDHDALKEDGHSRVVSQLCVGASSEVNPCSQDHNRAVQNYCETLDIGCYHGMSVAGLAAGKHTQVSIEGQQSGVGGVAPEADISYVREAMNKTGTIKYENFVAALNEFLNEVRTGTSAAPDVINLSLSFPRDSYQDCEEDNEVKRSIDELVARGVVIVAASGNDSDKSRVSYPACMKNVIAVGSTTMSRDAEVVSSFSNTSSDIDIVAPGDDVLSYLPQESQYAHVSGTSFAAPLVSGAVALIKQAKPELSPTEIEHLLVSTGDIVAEPATGAQYSRLNVGNALATLAPVPAKVVVDEATSSTTQDNAEIDVLIASPGGVFDGEPTHGQRDKTIEYVISIMSGILAGGFLILFLKRRKHKRDTIEKTALY